MRQFLAKLDSEFQNKLQKRKNGENIFHINRETQTSSNNQKDTS